MDGLPALQHCAISFRVGGVSKHALVALAASTFGTQRDNLRDLTLRGTGSHIQLNQPFQFLSDMPALRHLVIQNLGLTDLRWLNPDGTGLVLADLHSLDVDGNRALQLDDGSVTALLSMAALKKLSMRKTLAAEADTSTGAAGKASKAASRKAAWSSDSVHCIAQLIAGRPDLQLCF